MFVYMHALPWCLCVESSSRVREAHSVWGCEQVLKADFTTSSSTQDKVFSCTHNYNYTHSHNLQQVTSIKSSQLHSRPAHAISEKLVFGPRKHDTLIILWLWHTWVLRSSRDSKGRTLRVRNNLFYLEIHPHNVRSCLLSNSVVVSASEYFTLWLLLLFLLTLCLVATS